MKNPSRKLIILSLAGVTVFAAGLIWSGKATLNDGFASSAEARIRRPLTPMSYAAGAQNDASSGGLWRGRCSGSGRRLRGDTGMCAGRGCLRADLHEVLINPQASERSAFCQTELGCNMAREADFVLPRARLEPDGINVDDHHTGISRRGAWLLSQRGNARPVRRLACGACGISTLCGEAHAGM